MESSARRTAEEKYNWDVIADEVGGALEKFAGNHGVIQHAEECLAELG